MEVCVLSLSQNRLTGVLVLVATLPPRLTIQAAASAAHLVALLSLSPWALQLLLSARKPRGALFA
jgi:hypothetical protein